MPTDSNALGLVFRKVFVLGGARSGKTAFAEQLAAECGEPVLYVATATASDEEMRARIARHRAERPPSWRSLDAPRDVAASISRLGSGATTVIVEDLTLLLSNLMAEDTATAEARARHEVNHVLTVQANVILVSNEVGMGIVPEHPLGRLFRDALGRLNQAAAAACAEVYLLVAGLSLRLK